MIHLNDPYKFGFYQVQNHKFFSKLEAIEYQRRVGGKLHWNFNDEVFNQFDWSCEPNIDLWELYKARARQIRESYDYVVLFYSGGSDSGNILSAWLAADCKVDEIASIWNLEGSKSKESFMNQEINQVVLPKVKQLKDSGMDFTFRLIDISQNTVDFINSVGEDYAYFVSYHFSPNNIVKGQFRERISDYADIINSGKKLCFVWGIEKPQIFYSNDFGHCLQFADMLDNCISPYTQNKVSQGWYDEMFYWTPDMPELVIKQAHTLLNFANTCDHEDFYQTNFHIYGYNKKLRKYITSNAAKLILYPQWDPNTYCNGKARSMVFSDRDSWIWDGNIDELAVLKSISRRYFNGVGSLHLNNINDTFKGIKSSMSQPYYLEYKDVVT